MDEHRRFATVADSFIHNATSKTNGHCDLPEKHHCRSRFSQLFIFIFQGWQLQLPIHDVGMVVLSKDGGDRKVRQRI